MKYRCLIIDDEELARELVENHLGQLNEFELVASCASAIAARKYLQSEKIDLLFLDIEMPVLNGTEFYKGLLHKPHVIFTTAYREYAIDGFDLNAVDYLLKPITFDRFFKATEKFLQLQQSSPEQPISIRLERQTVAKYLFIRKDRKQVKLILDDILFIESLKDYIKIHLSSDTVVAKYSISAFEKLLPSRFLRIHRSFIVHTDKINAYTKQDVEIGKKEIPIGESYRDNVYDALSRVK